MSCNCGSIKIILPGQTCPDTGVYTASNENLTGVGVYLEKVGNNFQFAGIASGDGTIDVTYDSDNKVINIALDSDIVAGNFPDATTALKGKVQLATDAAAQAKSSTTLVLTPSNLAALQGSTVFAGLLELATSPETITGTDAVRAVTPAGLKAVTDTIQGTKVASNGVVVAATTPSFAGQFLYQQDARAIWAANSTSTGDWVGPTINDGGVGGSFNISGGTTLKIGGVTIPGSSVLMTSATPGAPTSYTVADNFLSNFNVVTYSVNGYTPGNRTIANAGTITLPELADVVSNLIADLMANQKPDAGG